MSRVESPRGVESEDLVVEALEAPLAFADELGIEAGLAVARGLDLGRAVLGRQRLGCRPVARVAGPAWRLLVRLVSQVLGQLRLQRPLH